MTARPRLVGQVVRVTGLGEHRRDRVVRAWWRGAVLTRVELADAGVCVVRGHARPGEVRAKGWVVRVVATFLRTGDNSRG